MTKLLQLSTGLGEVLAPQTLVIPLILAPDGTISVEPGALHGRSNIESALRFVTRLDQLSRPRLYWVAWVAVELDAADQPLRYKGIAVSELWVDAGNKTAYKVLAENVNRMSEAMRGGVNLKTLEARQRQLVREQLTALHAQAWERSAAALQGALR